MGGSLIHPRQGAGTPRVAADSIIMGRKIASEPQFPQREGWMLFHFIQFCPTQDSSEGPVRSFHYSSIYLRGGDCRLS